MSKENTLHTNNATLKSFRESLSGSYSLIGFGICGAVSGAVSRTCAAPFERLKILFQVQDMGLTNTLEKEAKEGKKYRGIVSGLVQIGKEEGLIGYFKGNGTNIVRIVPYTSAQFLAYEQYKIWFSSLSEDGQLSTVSRLICGGLSGMTSIVVSYPLDVIRCRLSAQVEPKLYNGIMHAFKVIYQQEGMAGLYRGMVPTLLGIAPYVALNFTAYEKLKLWTLDYLGTNELGIVTKLALGAISGTFSQTVSYPLDVVRRRMQMLGVGGKTPEYTSMTEAFRRVYSKYGFIGFYKGLIPNYLKVVPVVSINFVVYEYMKKLLGLARSGSEV
ncbi:hypothetical protein ABK040_008417 [Willaertia magna]